MKLTNTDCSSPFLKHSTQLGKRSVPKRFHYLFDRLGANTRKGGGIALICRSNMTVREVDVPQRSSFEMCEWSLSSSHCKMRLSILCRPPWSSNNPVTISTFMTEFAAYRESVVLCAEPLLICGDFNFHVDVYDDPNFVTFTDLLDSMSLEQHVKSPTQLHGHTLDLIITRKS